MSWWSYKPYVSVAEKRTKALDQIHKLQKKGQAVSPVTLEGKKIAHTFWGKAWCDNVDSYSDFDNRLPRGRTYVRNGSVIDLQIAPGKITGLVQGSELYKVQIELQPATAQAWRDIQRACAGQIGSLVELLQGKLSKGVMEIITRPGSGLFPKPGEIKKSCSCYDWADVCKHVAAVMYGVGARLDQSPELLFKLRQVDHMELITSTGDVAAITTAPVGRKTIATGDLADVFGIELEPAATARTAAAANSPPRPQSAPDRRTKGTRKAQTHGKSTPSVSRKKSKPGAHRPFAVSNDAADSRSTRLRPLPVKTAAAPGSRRKSKVSQSARRHH